MHKYSRTRRWQASISKRTLSIEINFGFPEVLGKRSLTGKGILNTLYLTFRLWDLGET